MGISRRQFLEAAAAGAVVAPALGAGPAPSSLPVPSERPGWRSPSSPSARGADS